ncbi:alpha/beta fold hydrolase [Variovorax sp. OV329]|uniref:alpha/beta fold hydrolase n=1 Tax=Variovorax sp. OV329 TaxID=1882825 RepID=UPI0008F01FEA|nr:alpha/beta hydrolase [Variovorax sp. OV329]SFL88272.1 Pimeloyl-ACP methyl ester carboxylesterase [Variovorax sp. OV329]
MTTMLPASELARLESRFAARSVALPGGEVVSVRECGAGQGGPVFVCLHGIGSGAASWLEAALLLEGQGARVIAWDAPGYGDSTPVASQQPKAADYAQRLQGLVDALDLERFVLVGHSLGAITAGHAARTGSAMAARIAKLVLISPAAGYGAPGKEEAQQRVRTQRLATLAQEGIAGMAAKSDQRLLSAQAGELPRQWVRWNMGRLHEAGYAQAVELLCGADLLADLPPAVPVHVACGSLDVVTTPEACEKVAAACGLGLELATGAGHASYVEQPAAVAALLLREAARA